MFENWVHPQNDQFDGDHDNDPLELFFPQCFQTNPYLYVAIAMTRIRNFQGQTIQFY